jgi:hypothetical protein
MCHHISLVWPLVHGIRANLDAHPNWVVLEVDIVNAFNAISRKAIFQKLRAIEHQFS